MLKYIYSNTILFGGDDSQRATPVPIPNTEVKSLGADGTAGEAQWESRLSPPFYFFVQEVYFFCTNSFHQCKKLRKSVKALTAQQWENTCHATEMMENQIVR